MKTNELTKIALVTAIICICAPISIPIPFSPVMLTLCTFALYLAAYILTPKQALFATGLYILIGVAGVPVFSGYTAGISKFAGPGGGYLIGYLFLVGISSFFAQKFSARPRMQMLGASLGTIVCYIIGTFWMAKVIHASFWATLPAGALVFLPLDFVKILLSCYVGRRMQIYLARAQRV